MNMDGYITVNQRLTMALERWPELRVTEQEPTLHMDWPGGPVVLCTVTVHRTPDDPYPLVGRATEPIPGRTPFTKGSEVMNGNTSALGRALGYAGIGIAGGMATADEIEYAKARQQPVSSPDKPTQARTAQLGARANTARNPATPAQLAVLTDLGYSGPSPASENAAARLIASINTANQQAPR